MTHDELRLCETLEKVGQWARIEIAGLAENWA